MGERALSPLFYAWGKALECAQDYTTAKQKFARAAAAGDPEWSPRSRQEIQRMDEYIEYETKKQQRAAQGG
jgi:hypothetical protein